MQYITKSNCDAAQLFWQELVRARFKASPQARQVYCLSDFSAAALVHDYPRDRVSRPPRSGAWLGGLTWRSWCGCALLEEVW